MESKSFSIMRWIVIIPLDVYYHDICNELSVYKGLFMLFLTIGKVVVRIANNGITNSQ